MTFEGKAGIIIKLTAKNVRNKSLFVKECRFLKKDGKKLLTNKERFGIVIKISQKAEDEP